MTEVEYPKAKLYKRWFAFFIDFFLMLILTLCLSSLIGFVTTKIPAYIDKVNEREEIQNSSSIYVDGKSILFTIDEDKETVKNNKETLYNAIEEFYKDDTFFSDNTYYMSYQNRKKDKTNKSGEHIFVESTTQEGIYVESDFEDSLYYDFYYSEINDYCIALMSLNSDYASISDMIVRVSVIELIASGLLGFLVSFVFIPLILKRGRKTLGFYLFKISLISADALNVSGKTLLARNMLLIFIGYFLSIVTFGFPIILSVTMMHLSKRGQDFFDYVSNTYVVDTSRKDVYLNYNEYLQRGTERKEASIENKDFDIGR